MTAARASFVSDRRTAWRSRSGRSAAPRLYRGRELIGARLAWSGFGYSFPPALGGFGYELTDRAGPMTSVLLIYPFFRGARDRSRFRFPPLGPAYVAAALREAGHEVDLLDCTFLGRDEALAQGAGGQGAKSWASTPWPR